LKLTYDEQLSNSAFKLALRHYNLVAEIEENILADKVGRCKLKAGL